MTVSLNQSQDCCEPVCDNTAVNIPGPQGVQGPAGADGSDGQDGRSSFSYTTSVFVMPPPGGVTNVSVDNTGWIVATDDSDTQVIFIGGAGHFTANGKGLNHITIAPLYYPGDPATEGLEIAVGKIVAPAGVQGPAGADGDIILLDAKGQLATHNGIDPDKLEVGNNGEVLTADSTEPLGIKWAGLNLANIPGCIDLDTQTCGQLDLENKSSGGIPAGDLQHPNGTAGDTLYWDGSSWATLPAGDVGDQLKVGATGLPAWEAATAGVFAAKGTFTSSGTSGVIEDNTFNIDSAVYLASGGSQVFRRLTLTFADEVPVTCPLFVRATDSSGNEVLCDTSSRTTTELVLNLDGNYTDPIFCVVIYN